MGLPRDITELEKNLLKNDSDPFSPGFLNESSEAQSLIPLLALAGFSEPSKALKLCLQALRIQSSENVPNVTTAEFVATIPNNVPGLARSTNIVLLEMIKAAEREIVILGYEFSECTLIEQLQKACGRGINVFIILDRERGAAEKILSNWPTGLNRPRIYHDKKRKDASPYASMHAKCLLVDEKDLLVTSANFTFHGLHGNIEIGVRLSGPSALEARKIFSHLVVCGMVDELI